MEISGVFSQYLNFFSLFLGSSGASTISSQNSMSGSYCLCVAVKRQVIIYEITRLKSRHKRLREVLLPAQAQSLDVFSEGRLCVGYQSGNFDWAKINQGPLHKWTEHFQNFIFLILHTRPHAQVIIPMIFFYIRIIKTLNFRSQWL